MRMLWREKKNELFHWDMFIKRNGMRVHYSENLICIYSAAGMHTLDYVGIETFIPFFEEFFFLQCFELFQSVVRHPNWWSWWRTIFAIWKNITNEQFVQHQLSIIFLFFSYFACAFIFIIHCSHKLKSIRGSIQCILCIV